MDDGQDVTTEAAITERRHRKLTLLASAAACVLAGLVLWLWGRDIYTFLTDETALEALVVRLGPWGPIALILTNVVQIVVAPIPGYVVQLAAGYLYGPLKGGIYAGIGVLVGAMTAMWLARTLGRPVARLLVGESRLARWETVTHSDSPWIWLLLLLGPIGDVPYTLAGLSSVPYLTIFLITLFVRVPAVFLSTAIGGGALSLYWLFVVVGIAGGVLIVGMRYKKPLGDWYERTLHIQAGVARPNAIPAPLPTMELSKDEPHVHS